MSSEELIPRKFLEDILNHRLNIIADPQMGKTNLSRVLSSEIVKLPNVQIKVFDTTQVYRHNFLSSFKCQEINDNTQKVFDGEDGIVFDIEYLFPERIAAFIGNVVLVDYQRNRERKKAANGVKLNDWIVYVLEEAQNSLNTHALNRLDTAVLLKTICEAANFNLSYVFIGQRAQDISTKALERSTCYFIGKTIGDNNTRKLRGIIGSKAGLESKDGKGLPVHERAKQLAVGEFIFYNGVEAWTFKCPKFEDLYPNQRPELIVPIRSRWSQIF